MMKKYLLIIVFLSLLFCSLVKPILAVEVKVTGKIFDQKNNPVTPGVIVFETSDGKTVAAATSDPSGYYELSVPQGTYTITAQGPKGLGLESLKFSNKTISSPTVLNFTLKTPESVLAKKAGPGGNLKAIIAGGIICGIILITVALFVLKKKKPLPQPGSPN